MTRLKYALVVFGIVLIYFITPHTAFSKTPKQIYLVETRNKIIMSQLGKYFDTFYDQGRVLGVTLKQGIELNQLPPVFQKVLTPISSGEIAVYSPQRSNEEPNPDILKIINTMTPPILKASVSKLVSFTQRGSGTPDNEKASLWIAQEFKQMGYQTQRDCFRGNTCNVLGLRVGNQLPNEFVVVLGHLDSVNKPNAGADDNASGAMGVLEMARALKERGSERSIIYLATNGEEQGMVGSSWYVKELTQSGMIKQFKFAINMDMVAYSKNGSKKFDIETNTPFKAEADWLARQAQVYTTLIPRITMPAWGSDHVPFLKAQVPTLLTIEDWDAHTPCYHQACDTLDGLDFDFATQIIRLNLAALIQKAGVELSQE